jgi:hypothetical protein
MGRKVNLLDYIDYFKRNDVKFYELKTPIEGNRIVRYYDYDIFLLNFLDEFTSTDMIDYSYTNNIKKLDFNEINKMNKKEIGTVLTYYLRIERFSAGSWAKAIDNRIFLKCLERLQCLIEYEKNS